MNATLYTSGEHCPMCAGAHAWAEIGKVAYISSGSQLALWLKELNLPDLPIRFLPIEDIVKNIIVKGPAEGKLLERIRQMHIEYFKKE
jgi:tRNA(Arg) A34 adenosine deaminase TadA